MRRRGCKEQQGSRGCTMKYSDADSTSHCINRAPKSGLVVTVNPGSSAFFAGEIFTATITFSNASPAESPTVPPTPSSPIASPLGYNARNRPPSASHQGLAEYATSSLDHDTVPPSPAFGSTSGDWGRSVSASSIPPAGGPPRPVHSRRPSFASALSGGASPSSKSSPIHSAPPLPSPNAINRSETGGLGGGVQGGASEQKPKPLPTRKGLIGKPIPLAPPVVERKSMAGGLYGGPRRPGAPRGHARSQSMAVSSPELVGTGGGPATERSVSAREPGVKLHGRSRLGGSMAVDLKGRQGLQETSSNGRGQSTKSTDKSADGMC